MGSISAAIELQDNFTSILMNVINAVNMSVSAMEQMQATMNGQIDTAALQGMREQLNQATIAAQELDAVMQNIDAPAADVQPAPVILPVEPSAPDPLLGQPETVQIPVVWQSDNLEVFTSSGIERFGQEVQSTNAMLQQLSSTQDAIARQAYNANIFPPEAFQNLNTMAVRIDNIRDRIQTIENNPLNMGTDTANAELEQLRAQLSQAVQVQELMNQAVQDMDVQAANEAYLRLSQIIGNTERHIRDNVDEQGRFNDEIREGIDNAAGLKNMIAGAVGAFAGIAGLNKAKDWIDDCTAAFNTQLNAETQLISVLANTLDGDYVAQFEMGVMADTTAAVDGINAIQAGIDEVVIPVTASAETEALVSVYDQITGKASEIQGRGVFGDEAMIAGAAELSTYFSDPEAVMSMMDTLANYAMGMNALDGKGLAVDSASMVAYATNLGKIMTGTYTAMSQKGFAFTDAQKAVIEGAATEAQVMEALGAEYLDMSADMQAAAVIDSVIGESWDGLYEIMSNTPEGKIIQMNNTWGDMKEVIGGQLYPYVLLFVDAITQNWGTIQAVLDNITFGLQVMLGVLSWLMEGAINFAQVVMDNWGWISPIIYGIIGALAVYGTYLAITKGMELASAAAKGVMTIAENIHAAAIAMTTGATMAEAAAQEGLNSAMYACPIVWIIILIIALIALFYAAVAAVNHFAGTSVSATGIICGVFATAGAFIWDLILGVLELVLGVLEYLINPFINIANFIGNVFTSPISSIIYLFQGMADTVLGILQKIASALDFVFGSNMADTVQGWRDGLKDAADALVAEYAPNENYQEVISTLDFSVSDIGLERIAYSDAWDAGYSFGEGIDESIANFDPSSLFGTTDIPSADDYASTLAAGGIGSGIDDIAGNTGAMADAMDITGEELKYLRDIAEQESINRFTTAEIHLEQTNHNTIKNGMDLDGIMSSMTDMVNEAIEISTEGVHG